jgi:hypothetical protein
MAEDEALRDDVDNSKFGTATPAMFDNWWPLEMGFTSDSTVAMMAIRDGIYEWFYYGNVWGKTW